MSKPRCPARILSFEEFMRQPRTPQQIETYHRVVAAMQRLGMVDEESNVIRTGTLR